MKKTIILVVFVVLALGVYYKYSEDRHNLSKTNPVQIANPDQTKQTETANSNSVEKSSVAPLVLPEQSEEISQEGSVSPSGGTFSSGETLDGGVDIQVHEIAYDGKKYTPDMLIIKLNDYVIFKNSSDDFFWPASAPHPSHTIYPEFDAKDKIAAGGKFQFQFTKAGSWSFHDHLNPLAFGKITVTK